MFLNSIACNSNSESVTNWKWFGVIDICNFKFWFDITKDTPSHYGFTYF